LRTVKVAIVDSLRWSRARDLFELALRKTDADRDAFLSEACGADRDLRADVEGPETLRR
jgi:hypothetical protein